MTLDEIADYVVNLHSILLHAKVKIVTVGKKLGKVKELGYEFFYIRGRC